MRLNFTQHELKTPSNIYAPLFDGQSFPLLVTELLSALMKPLHFCVLSFSNYAWLMLAAVRALVEQQPAEEDYSKFRWNMILFHSALTRLSVSGNDRKEKRGAPFPWKLRFFARPGSFARLPWLRARNRFHNVCSCFTISSLVSSRFRNWWLFQCHLIKPLCVVLRQLVVDLNTSGLHGDGYRYTPQYSHSPAELYLQWSKEDR